MTRPAPDDRRRPPGRYDEPSVVSQRVLAVILSALFIGLLLAIGSLLYNRSTGDQVRGRVLAFKIVDDKKLMIEVEVSKRKGSTAYCVIRARGRDGREVGRDVAVLDAAGDQRRTVRGTFTLVTSARAVTGELAGCRAEPVTQDDLAP